MRFWQRLCTGEEPGLSTFIEELGHPWLCLLEQTPQDPEWHGEGDVAIHTEMVLQALYAYPLPAVAPERRAVQVLGAALHDIAKPVTTRIERIGARDRVVARRHEAIGRSALAHLDALPFAALWRVMGLVGSHHEPKLLVVKDRPMGDWRRVSRRACMADLAALELADMRGRLCPDREAQVERIDWFAALADEQAPAGWGIDWRQEVQALCAERPPAVRALMLGETLRALEAGRIADPRTHRHLAHALPDAPPELVILIGPAGSGKSRFVARHLSGPNDHLVSMDDLRERLGASRGDQSANGAVRQAAREALRAGLRAGRRVVWDATSLRAELRAPLIALGQDYGALVTLVWIRTPPLELRRRNRSRSHPVPDGVLEGQMEALQVPEVDEAHRLLVLGAHGELLGWSGAFEGPGLPWGLPASGEGPAIELDAAMVD
jgi:predicted kinase